MILSLLLISMIPWLLGSFLMPDLHTSLRDAQNLLLEEWENGSQTLQELPRIERSGSPFHVSALYHMVIYADGRIDSPTIFPVSLAEEMVDYIISGEEPADGTSLAIEEANLYFVVGQLDEQSQQAYLVTYLWDYYSDEVMQGLFTRFIAFIGAIFIICLIPALLLARYISRPLVALESHVRQIADRNWHQPIRIKRRDEIGSLGTSIEKMRQRLIQQDQAQQSFLQNISHELKTPVMVIRSYIQSIKDGIFPQGNLDSTIKVIDEESERLEKRIQDLLYLTKIDYLSAHEAVNTETVLSAVLQDVIRRMERRRSELKWQVELSEGVVSGAPEQWTVVFENLLDNQIRYATGRIEIAMNRSNSTGPEQAVCIRLWNDGPPIDEQVMARLFRQFSSGPGGQFGLGLSIVQRLVWLNRGKIWAANEADGAAFYLEIPLAGKSVKTI